MCIATIHLISVLGYRTTCRILVFVLFSPRTHRKNTFLFACFLSHLSMYPYHYHHHHHDLPSACRDRTQRHWNLFPAGVAYFNLPRIGLDGGGGSRGSTNRPPSSPEKNLGRIGRGDHLDLFGTVLLLVHSLPRQPVVPPRATKGHQSQAAKLIETATKTQCAKFAPQQQQQQQQ